MLDINLFRVEKGHDPERIRESQRKRFARVELVDEIIDLDKKWRERQFEADKLRQEVNKVNKEIAKKKMAKLEDIELMSKMKELVELKTEKEKEVNEAKEAVELRLREVGNLVHDSVPYDNNEDNNVVVRTWGTPREDAGLLSHVDLVQHLGIVDLDAGTDVAGGRGYFLKHYGVLLNQALINFGLAFLLKRNYTPLQTPFFMRKEVMAECAQLAQFDEELYKVSGEGDDKYLIATAEQPICALHREKWMDTKSVPIRYAGYSTCFRKEAGSHGRDTLGIFRVHQFEKVEQFCITSPHGTESWDMHEEMLKNSEDFYQELELPYRVVSIVSGALNDSAAKKYDLEAWFPASKTFRELVSCSNCTDYQSRNLEIRYGQKKMNDQVKHYVHLLNSTLTATERTLCCILENYQTREGVRVPEALKPFMLGIEFLPFQTVPSKGKTKSEQWSLNKTAPRERVVDSKKLVPEKKPNFETMAAVPGTFDVFLNHRGPSVMHNFAEDLHQALQEAGCRPFLDMKSLEKGQHGQKNIYEALGCASVHVAIFSKHYADSNYCLNELCAMLESEKLIIPVFYDVSPSDLRCESHDGPYTKAFLKINRGRSASEVKKWKDALRMAAELNGFKLDDYNGDETQLKTAIVSKVCDHLRASQPPLVAPYAPYQVGLKETAGHSSAAAATPESQTGHTNEAPSTPEIHQ